MIDMDLLNWNSFCRKHMGIWYKLRKLEEMSKDDEVFADIQHDVLCGIRKYNRLLEQYFEGWLSSEDIGDEDGTMNDMVKSIFSQFKHDWYCAYEPTFMALANRAKNVESGDDLLATFEQLATDAAMLELQIGLSEKECEDAIQKNQEELNKYRNLLFSWVLTYRNWSYEFLQQIEKIMASQLVDRYTKAMLVSAVTLAGCTFNYDVALWILDRMYSNHESPVIRQRALVGIILMYVLYPENKACTYNGDFDMESKLKDKRFFAAVIDLQRQMRLCLTSEKDSLDMMNNVMKNVFSKVSSQLAEQLENQEDIEMDGFHASIDADDDDDDVFGDAMDAMINSENVGVDVNYRQFMNMKSFGHFHSLYNWFMPFYLENSTLSSVRDLIKKYPAFFSHMVKGTMMCDSDLYSLVLSLRPELLETMDIPGLDALDGEADAREMNEADLDETFVRHQYVQDLYRFYTLSPMRKSFDNPFDLQCEKPFMTVGVFDDPKYDKVRLSLARFSAKRSDYSFIKDILRLVDEPTKEESFMLALSHFEVGEFEEAADLCLELLKNDDKNIAIWELCMKCFDMLDRDMAIECVDHILELETNPERKFDYLLQKLDLLLKYRKYVDALTLAYQLDNDYPKNEQVECRLAFCIMFSEPRKEFHLEEAIQILAPYLKVRNNKLKELMGADLQNMDHEEAKQMVMKVMSSLMEDMSKHVDYAWEAKKIFYYALCIWVVEGGNECVETLKEHPVRPHQMPFDSALSRDNMLAWLRDFGITELEISFIVRKVELIMKQNARK